jgi:hypothetical protein
MSILVYKIFPLSQEYLNYLEMIFYNKDMLTTMKGRTMIEKIPNVDDILI